MVICLFATVEGYRNQHYVSLALLSRMQRKPRCGRIIRSTIAVATFTYARKRPQRITAAAASSGIRYILLLPTFCSAESGTAVDALSRDNQIGISTLPAYEVFFATSSPRSRGQLGGVRIKQCKAVAEWDGTTPSARSELN